MPARKKVSTTGQKRVSQKVSRLAHQEPAMPPKQRIAIALNMERAGRLGPKGGYKPKRKSR